MPAERIDIGHGVQIELRYGLGDPATSDPVGVAYWHPRPGKREMCHGYAPVSRAPMSHEWRLESLDPLTVSPSILCTICGHHGFIVQGKWMPA